MGSGALPFAQRRAVIPGPRVMCLGDSITLGTGSDSTGGYRGFLWQTMPGFRPIGTSTQDSLVAMLGTTAYDQHDGFGGQNISVIASSLPGYLAAVGAPDVVLFNTGANDGWDITVLGPNMATIYGLFQAANPKVMIIQGAPTINPSSTSGEVAAWATNQPLVANKVSQLGGICCALPFLQDSDMFDSLHPVASGYTKIAAAWAKTLCSYGLSL
jgi:lysophospholipase L1-like esterase